ncbi:hypothetical protein ACSYS8_000313 [Stenotrophomonas muris]|uniref:hypothetical protein n=1 Tax=Stenotrophomonas muris TaxID=2963283 RepID=UPI0039C67DFF
MLAALVKSIGPCLSTELTEFLVSKRGMTPAAARQRVSRGDPQVKRLAHLPFARRARFTYHQDDYASPRYWDRLHAAIFAVNGPYARALGAVQAREVVPEAHFLAVCGAPLAQKKQISAATLLQRLVDANVLAKANVPGLGMCVMSKKTYELNLQWNFDKLAVETRARLVAEGILLESVKEWLRRLAIASYNKVHVRGAQMPRVGTFTWDLAAPSYLTSTITMQKDKGVKPGWVVCDVLLVESVRAAHIEPFLHKVRSTEALKNIGRTLYIMVAHGYEEDAFKALRGAGVIPATPASLFGKDAADGFRDLAQTLQKAAEGVVDPEKFDALFAKLGKLEGAVGNMRGALFELLVAEVVRKKTAAQVKLNKICRGEDGIAEVDVYCVNEGVEALMIECKGMAPGTTVDDEEVVLWLTTRINRVREHLRRIDWSGPLPKFELWTSGNLSENARSRVERTRNANAKKYELTVLEAGDLRARVKALNDLPLLKTFEQHFLPQASS